MATRDCPNCGAAQKVEDRFCAFCGTEFPQDAAPTITQTININVNTAAQAADDSQPDADRTPESHQREPEPKPSKPEPAVSKSSTSSSAAPGLIVLVIIALIAIVGFGIASAVYNQRTAEQQKADEAFAHWKASCQRLADTIKEHGIQSVVVIPLEYEGGFEIPLLGKNANMASAERAEEGLFLLIQNWLNESTSATCKRDASYNKAENVAYLASKVISFEERGHGVRVEMVRLQLTRSTDDSVPWSDGWNLPMLAKGRDTGSRNSSGESQ